MEAAGEDTSNANGCRPNECLLIEMRHDRYMHEYAQRASSLHMQHMLHEND